MYFGRSAFNRSFFNRAVTKNNELSGRIQVNYTLSTIGYSSQVPFNGRAGSTYYVSAANWFVDMPFSGSVRQIYNVIGKNTVDLVITGAVAGMVFAVSGTLRLDDSQSISLDGVDLAPGDTIIIDTDTLDVLVNGVNRIDVFQQGGEFFMLKPGVNIIEVYTDQETTPLTMTVVYQSRWF